MFISLYWVLIEAVELRHAPWVLWIQNLTAPDPLFVLPVLNLATMWLTQKLSPSPGMDPMQKRIMQIMPLAFRCHVCVLSGGPGSVLDHQWCARIAAAMDHYQAACAQNLTSTHLATHNARYAGRCRLEPFDDAL
jgi:hypothetical protein